jgi:hypothetical protein
MTKPIITPKEQLDEGKLSKQREVVAEVKKLLDENDLTFVVSHLINIVPKK